MEIVLESEIVFEQALRIHRAAYRHRRLLRIDAVG
jgi:hypothetical protein